MLTRLHTNKSLPSHIIVMSIKRLLLLIVSKFVYYFWSLFEKKNLPTQQEKDQFLSSFYKQIINGIHNLATQKFFETVFKLQPENERSRLW